MNVPISEAKGQLTDLVRRAEAGEEVVLTRHGQPVAKLVPVERKPTTEEKRQALERVAEIAKAAREAREARGEVTESAARSQDFLYDEHGLPK